MGNRDCNGNGNAQCRWWLQLPTVMETPTADGEGKGKGDGWWQCKRDGSGDGQWRLQQQWPTATVMAIGYGNVDSNGNGDDDSNDDGDGDCNGNGHGNGDNDEGRITCSCAGNVQRYGRDNTLPPPPWTQRKVHSPALRHGGDTAKSVCSFSRGRISDSSPWIVFLFFYNYCSIYWTTLCLPPPIIQALKNHVSPLMLYLLHSSKKIVRLLMIYPGSYCTFCQGKPGQGLQWLQPYFFALMWNDESLSNLLYFPNLSSVIDRTHQIHLKTPCCDSWDIQGQSLSWGLKALSCTTLLPSLGAHICLATF